MARIGVVLSHPPFARGGHLVMTESLVQALREHGHESEIIYTPQNRHGRQGAAYLATGDRRRREQRAEIDRVISLRFPAYAVRHEQRLLAHARCASATVARVCVQELERKGRFRKVSGGADSCRRPAIARPGRLRGSSRVGDRQGVSQTLTLAAEVLHPPLQPRGYRCDRRRRVLRGVAADTARSASISSCARWSTAAHGLRVTIAGDGSNGDLRAGEWLDIEDRVSFVNRVDDEALTCTPAAVPSCSRRCANWVRGRRAFASHKPVITCVDSGTTEVVDDERNGFVVASTAPAVAAAMRRLADDPALAERLGAAGHALNASMTWDRVVGRLVVV
jgi:hypothetical protein